MNTENTKARSHEAIAFAIKSAKRKMFEASRNGIDLREATQGFLTDVIKQFSRIVEIGGGAAMSENEARRLDELLGHSTAQPPKYDYVDESPARARNRLADAVAEILRNELAPPSLRDAVVAYVTDEPPRRSPAPDSAEESDEPPTSKRYVDVIEELGLDMATIDRIADAYLTSGDDDHLILTIGLLRRLLKLAELKARGAESVENYLTLLIARLFRSTYQVEGMADDFATAAEARLPRIDKDEGNDDE